MGLLEEITAEETMALARQRVKRNKGSAGIDGMTVQELDKYFMENGTAIRQSIMEGKYRPQPVRGVEIPKDNGKKRQLGIPTAVDRTIQQAITMKLTPIFEPMFSDTSGIIKRQKRLKPGPKKGSHRKQYDEDGNVIKRKPGPKPGSHHKKKYNKDGSPRQKPGPKPGVKKAENSDETSSGN